MALVRDLWMPSCLDKVTGPIWPSIEAENFELRPGLIALVQQNQFRGLPSEDPHEHIRNVLEYANTVQYHGVSHDAIKCMLFTFSLKDGAKNWYYSLPSRSYTWGEISQAFLERYFPLHKQSEIRDQILNFAQEGSESLYAAWGRYKNLLRKCLNHGLKDWLVLQIFYRGLTCASRVLIDMSAGGTIMNKTVEGAAMLIENLAFHQFQWYGEKHSSDLLSCCYQSTTPQQATLNQKPQPDAPCEKIELAWVLFDDDDDVILSGTHVAASMGTIATDSVLDLVDSFICEPELQSIVFDIEEPPLVHIDTTLLELDMEKFTFQDVSNIDSSSFEPEMEIFKIDDYEVASAVKESSSTTSIVDITSQESSTTIPLITSSVKVVLKLFLNHLRYAYVIGHSIDDLEGTVPITCVGCFVLSFFRFMFVHHLLRVDLRDDIPWDPGGFMVWC